MRQNFLSTLAGIFCLVFLLSVAPIFRVEAETINLKIANYFPPPSGQSKIMEQFIAEFEARAAGKAAYFNDVLDQYGYNLKEPVLT